MPVCVLRGSGKCASLCLQNLCPNEYQDNTIIATAIPKITDQFDSLGDVGWYGSAYLLTTCSVILMFGKFYTFYSTKWIYLLALSIFEVGSLVCGVTPSSVGLICGRAIAGLGAAGLFSGSILIISQSVPLAKRPMYTGLVGSMFGIASVAGPLYVPPLIVKWWLLISISQNGRRLYRPSDLAVVLLHQPAHRRNYLFFVLVFFKAPRAIKKKNDLPWQQQLAQFDLLGSLFFLPSIISLLLALQWGGTKYEWNNPRIIALFCVFGVGILIFVGVQYWGGDRATVPPRLIKNRNVWGAAWYALAIGAAFFVITYYVRACFPATLRMNLADETDHLLAPYLVPSDQRRHGHEIWHHEPANDHRCRGRLHSRRWPGDSMRLLHTVHDRLVHHHDHRRRPPHNP